MVHLSCLRIIDLIFTNNWFDIDLFLRNVEALSSGQANSLLILTKFMFKLNAIFNGSFTAERVAYNAQNILIKILEENRARDNIVSKKKSYEGINNNLLNMSSSQSTSLNISLRNNDLEEKERGGTEGLWPD